MQRRAVTPVDYFTLVETSHAFEKFPLPREVANKLDYTLVFSRRFAVPTRRQPAFAVELHIADIALARTSVFHGSGNVRTLWDVDATTIKGTIDFHIDECTSKSSLTLSVVSDGQYILQLDLGTYDHAPDLPGKLLRDLIQDGLLLRLPQGRRPIEVSTDWFTNIIPSPEIADRRNYIERLAALAAVKMRSLDPSGHISLWQPPGRDVDAITPAQTWSLDTRLDEVVQRIKHQLRDEYGFSCGQGPAIQVTCFQTRTFADDLAETGFPGIAIFGFEGTHAPVGILPVIDLSPIWQPPPSGLAVTDQELARILQSGHSERLEDFLSIQVSRTSEIESPYSPPPSTLPELEKWLDKVDEDKNDWRKSIPQHANRTILSGAFLTSEPRLANTWLDLSVIPQSFFPQLFPRALEWLLRRMVQTGQVTEPIFVVNLIQEELPFSAGIELHHKATVGVDVAGEPDAGIECTMAEVRFDGNKLTTTCSAFTTPPRDHASAVVITPIDSYRRALDAVTSHLANTGYELRAIVSIFSVAKSVYLGESDWHVPRVPVFRLNGRSWQLNPTLCEDQ